ncbi:hypothetical protein D3C77_344770 [compost metagenome]
MDQRIWNHRRSLGRTQDKIASGKLIVGFIGGFHYRCASKVQLAGVCYCLGTNFRLGLVGVIR